MTSLSSQVDAQLADFDQLGAQARVDVLTAIDSQLRQGLDSPAAPPAPGALGEA
ncbi:hypothetical protein HMPREF1317_0783 [Schaalia georgiae F0490]|uniref:Uncharacterized protein n=1 Tax=Schaalia georgiae F0490 TaxID=1125717 RepID=J0XRV4_9ACTO|nr:hypothetical protein [Schaalia georgiae]EJF51586.1 hypothetical protein HMPREF1317_0783 [Schaalia georgiae F0490]